MIPSTSGANPVPPAAQANTDFHVNLIAALMELGRQSPAETSIKQEKVADPKHEMADLEEAAAKVEEAAAELEQATTGLEEAITKLEETAAEIKNLLAKPEKVIDPEEEMAELERALARIDHEAANLEQAEPKDTAALEEAELEGAAAYPAQVDLEQALQGASSQVRRAVELGDLRWTGNHDPSGYPILEGYSPERHDAILLTTDPNSFEVTGRSFPPTVVHEPNQVHADFECALWGFWCYHKPAENTQECYEALTKGMAARYGENDEDE